MTKTCRHTNKHKMLYRFIQNSLSEVKLIFHGENNHYEQRISRGDCKTPAAPYWMKKNLRFCFYMSHFEHKNQAMLQSKNLYSLLI